MAPRTRTTSSADDSGSVECSIARLNFDLGTLRSKFDLLDEQVEALAGDRDLHAQILASGLVDLDPALSQAEEAASDPFAGPVAPLLYGALAIAGVAGAVIDGAGMLGRAIRRP
jgi:hypothetical protein